MSMTCEWTRSSRKSAPRIERLVYPHLGDNQGSHMLVEPLHQLRSHHGKVLSQSRIEYFDKECLIFNKAFTRIFIDGFANNCRPCVNQTTLQQGRFQSIFAQSLLQDVRKCLYFSSKHPSPPFLSWVLKHHYRQRFAHLLTRHHVHNALYPTRIQLVKDIV